MQIKDSRRADTPGMDEDTGNELQAELTALLAEITRWQTRTSGFRLFNVILFGVFRVLTPIGSFVVAANVFAMAQGEGFMDPMMTLLVAGIVAAASGLDSILNPASKKRIAFKMSNDLRTLASKLRVMSTGIGQQHLAELLVEVSAEFQALQNEYADHGY